MRKAPLRLSCPACLARALDATTVTSGAKIHHCQRCGGTWLLRGQIPRLRTASARALRSMIRRANDSTFLCHDCHTPLDRDAASCPACGWANRLDCPECGKPMRRKSENGVTVDACGGCQGVWLDHHELAAALWTAAAASTAAAQAHGGPQRAVGAVADGGASFMLDVLWYSPELATGVVRGAAHVAGTGLEIAGQVAGSALQAASHAPGLLSSAPEMIGPALEVAGDVAGSVFGAILNIVAGIFDGI